MPASALSSTALINIVAPIMCEAGVPAEHCHPHVLRHTFATLYLQRRSHDAGALSKLQELLGHASIETTRGYVHHTRDPSSSAACAPAIAAFSTPPLQRASVAMPDVAAPSREHQRQPDRHGKRRRSPDRSVGCEDRRSALRVPRRDPALPAP
jgi:hypothetical protein